MIGTSDNPSVFFHMPHAPQVMMWQEGDKVIVRYPEGRYLLSSKSWRIHINEIITCIKVILLSPILIYKLGRI